MVIDYSERRQVRKPPPNRPKVWPYILVIFMLVVTSFTLGLGTGWYLYKPGGRLYKAPLQPAASKQTTSRQFPTAAVQAPPPQQLPQQAPPGEKDVPPLTFYNTLQKGNKVLMGTGINPQREGQAGGSKPLAPPPSER